MYERNMLFCVVTSNMAVSRPLPQECGNGTYRIHCSLRCDRKEEAYYLNNLFLHSRPSWFNCECKAFERMAYICDGK